MHTGHFMVLLVRHYYVYDIQGMMRAFRVEDLPIESKMLTKALDEAQQIGRAHV